MNAFTKRATTIVATGALSVGLIAGGTFLGGAAGAAELPASAVSSSASVLGVAGGVATDTTVKTLEQLRSDVRAAIKLDKADRPAALKAIRAEVLAGGYGDQAKDYLAKIDQLRKDVPKRWRIGLRHLVHAEVSGGGASTPTPAPTASPAPTPSS